MNDSEVDTIFREGLLPQLQEGLEGVLQEGVVDYSTLTDQELMEKSVELTDYLKSVNQILNPTDQEARDAHSALIAVKLTQFKRKTS